MQAKHILLGLVVLCALLASSLGSEESPTTAPHDEINPLTSEAEVALLVLGFVVVVVGSILVVFILIEAKFHYLPESVAVVIYGIILGAILRFIRTKVAEHLQTFDPEVFFLIALPAIIFEAGFSLQKRLFFDNIGTILILAFFGTAISFGIIGVLLYGLGQIGFNEALPMQDSMVAGAMLSTTDTVATLAIFQALGVDQQLYMIVFGESVLNDAVGYIFFKTAESFSGEIGPAIGLFMQVVVGSILIGIAMAVLLSVILKFINFHRYPPLETIYMIMFSYISYVMADALHLSGMLSVFWCGVVFSHYGAYSLSPYTKLTSQQLFRTLAFVCETSVFVYLGIAITTMKIEFHFGMVISVVLSCMAGRFIHVFSLCGILNFFKQKKLSWRMLTAIWWSGLMRGALAFSLAFELEGTESFEKILSATLVFVHFTIFTMGCGTLPLLKVLKIESGTSDQTLEQISQVQALPVASPNLRRGRITSRWERIDDEYLKKWLRRPVPPIAAEAIELFKVLTKTAEAPRDTELPNYTTNKRPIKLEQEEINSIGNGTHYDYGNQGEIQEEGGDPNGVGETENDSLLVEEEY